jgi:hypothetical protein
MKSLTLLPLLFAACASNDDSSSSSSLTQPPGQCGEIETHVFGIYQAPGDAATIHVDRPGRHALIISAHEATDWTITAGPDAKIEAVYAVGIGRQTVTAPTGAKVARDSQADGGPFACGYAYPDNGSDCDTYQLLNLTGKVINHQATSFHGCYAAGSFTVGEDMAVSADCDLDAGPGLSEFAACLGPDSCGGPILL